MDTRGTKPDHRRPGIRTERATDSAGAEEPLQDGVGDQAEVHSQPGTVGGCLETLLACPYSDSKEALKCDDIVGRSAMSTSCDRERSLELHVLRVGGLAIILYRFNVTHK